jgi:ubiquinone/menaquinone biosynthesis C-methylase UbiE
MKINLGCGNTKLDNYDEHLDRINFGFNKVCDFEFDKLPFDDNSVDYIYSHHVIEHLCDVQNILNETWRVLKDDGQFEIIVPYGLWRGASKPVHHQCITACWFDWLRRGDIFKWYGYKSWIIEKLEEIKGSDDEFYEVHCIMKPNKK